MIKNTPPNWDLTDLYKNISDPKIEKDKKQIVSFASIFEKTYKSKINSQKLTADFLLKALTDYEKILEKLYILLNYSSYLFSTNTKDSNIKNLYQKNKEFASSINSKILWFNLEWLALDKKYANKLISNSKLNSYKHYLVQSRALKAHTLSEKEEQIMSMKSQTSNSAFVRLYDQTESSEKFEILLDGKKQILNSSSIGSIMKSHSNRNIRELASVAYSKTYKQNSNLYTYILNTLLLDKKINDEIRNFSSPSDATLIEYEIQKDTLEKMSQAVLGNNKLVERFYLAKKKLLKASKLHEWDRYSTIYTTKNEKTYSWQDAKEIILSTFHDNSIEFHDIAKLFFENNWIDAKVKLGKRSGAFCSYGVPSTHPMILVNFSGKIEDITTLAHELGHGIHAYLSRNQKILQYDSSTAVAEMASTFAESLVFDKLYNETSDQKEKINLLIGKIQNNFASVFRQNDFHIFETKLHRLRREKGELTFDEISNLYQETLQKTFGNGLTLTSLHKNFWMPILHFYHYNFYVFTYVFGELLSLSVFAKYKKEGQTFFKKYVKALSSGGSLTPYELTKIMDIDLNQKDFWQKGLDIIKNEVDEFEKIIS